MYLAENKRKQLEVLEQLTDDSLTYTERTALQDELIELENERTKFRLIKQKEEIIRSITPVTNFEYLTAKEIAEIKNKGLNKRDIARYFNVTIGAVGRRFKEEEKKIIFYYNPTQEKLNKKMLLDADV
ncbi:TPA_asm: hypothetical protein GYP29_05790 [Listeria monocytogenes]|nr:hypothetical protein [Listeria monocytogenes]HAB7751308.1 hypothetical protein [Listeria monocytogenes]HAB7758112.1 hypothetical protein [Listeria monocytogenes]HAB7762074.1 hypothetical protein [Listeria monocytogenes]HAB7775776.1 hypothetical protein [Listeria monocytogenes]